MKFFQKEDYARVVDVFEGMTLTVETQQKIVDFMSEECCICYEYTDVNKKIVITLAKMKHTARNPENSPNWCITLSDGSQIVWNRRLQQFYHLGSHDISSCYYLDWKSLFPEIDWTVDLEWLTDNAHDWKFMRRMQMMLKWRQGIINTLDIHVRF